jgi:hypothetical protein
MAVITSRHQGLRPETIRTRLARFMPSRAATGWTVAWSAGYEHAEEIFDELELRTAEHLGCWGNTVAHALAQAELAPRRLRLSAEATNGDGDMPTITIEVRAHITGEDVDQPMFDAIIQRAEPSCPVLRGLATEANLKVVAILDESLANPVVQDAEASEAPAAQQQPAAEPASATRTRPEAAAITAVAAKAPTAAHKKADATAATARAVGVMSAVKMPRMSMPGTMSMPKWLTPRMAVLLLVAFGAFATVPFRMA